MTTNEWHTSGNGSVRTWTTCLDEHSDFVLYGPDSRRSNHSYAWAHWENGSIRGHARAGLIAYCEREGITLPDLPVEWCPAEWGLWVLDEYGNDSRVAVRADDSECIALRSDGSWGHMRGTDPWRASAIIRDSGFKGSGPHAARAYRAYAAANNLPQPPADWCPEPVEEPAKPDPSATESCDAQQAEPDPLRLSYRIRLLSHEAFDARNDELAMKLRDLADRVAAECL